MVRRPKRPRVCPAVAVQRARHRLDAGDLEQLRKAGRGHDAGQPPGQHRLARPGRPHHQQVVVPGGGDLQRAPGGRLAAYVAQVGAGRRRLRHRWPAPASDRPGRQGSAPPRRGRRPGAPAPPRRGRPRRRSRAPPAARPGRACRPPRRSRCAPWIGRSRPSRPSSAAAPTRPTARGLDLTAGGQDRERDGQVEAGPLLALARRRQVHGDPHRRELVGGGADAAAHPLARLLDGPIGQPHHREGGRGAALDVGLDVDAAGIDARDPEAGGASRSCGHATEAGRAGG